MKLQQLFSVTFSVLVVSALFAFCFTGQSLAHGQANNSQKLITAGGTITEIVFALDAGDSVIAVDQSSQYPQEVNKLPMVGYYRDLAAEGVLSFAPDKILAIEGVGRNEVIQQIKSTGVEVAIYDKPTSPEGLVTLIQQLGEDLGKTAEAEQLIRQFHASLPSKATSSTAKAVFLLSASDRGLIAAGTETVPQLIFSYAGIENIAAQHSGFKGINSEALAMQQPDFLVAPYHVVMSAGGKDKFCQSPNLSLLKAAQECRLLVMDSLQSLGMTPRLAQAIATVKDWRETNLLSQSSYSKSAYGKSDE
ncbi:heme/hemin ABC transporter substrate-binding protein [Alteromonas sp. A081]|uniref:heme/hemin ABC transporter substrate-binding protein n=1 Tax=Alteromonas sp. A081 TaxID=3410269 RepID=UPI003B981394